VEILEEIPQVDTSLEESYIDKTSSEHRKKFAQFFTPITIAELMTDWILGNLNTEKILEPAFGLGIFSRLLLEKKDELKIDGFELDPKLFKEAQKYFSTRTGVKILNKDYINHKWQEKYDGIICNPPYFKFHDFDNKKIKKKVEKNVDFNFNGLTNLYAFFLVKSIYQLKKNGRAAYIVPSEFLNSDYGESIKSYLLKSKALRHIIIIDFKENVFNDALTTASILLFAKDKYDKDIIFDKIESIEELSSLKKSILDYPSGDNCSKEMKKSDLDPQRKWRNYYEIVNAEKFKNLVPFSTFGKVVRGIATGANKYFKFNESKKRQYSISDQYLLPCISKSNDVKKTIFTKADFLKLKRGNKSVYILGAVDTNDENVNKYIKKGENEGINKKYLTSHRTPWYSVENRPPSPIWVTVFNRTGMKFIRNEANISNLTTFHCVYPTQPNMFSNINVELLFAYLLTDAAKEIFNDNRREYGDGLQKFEPNDINKSFALDLRLLNKVEKNGILDLYRKYRNSVINGISDNNYLKKINNIFLQKFSN
jgi:adenine-specific DNA-methyltransferase